MSVRGEEVLLKQLRGFGRHSKRDCVGEYEFVVDIL